MVIRTYKLSVQQANASVSESETAEFLKNKFRFWYTLHVGSDFVYSVTLNAIVRVS